MENQIMIRTSETGDLMPPIGNKRAVPKAPMRLGLVCAAILAVSVAPPSSADEIDPGERQFNRNCKMCHTIGADEPHRQGPNLHGIFNRRAGSVKDFEGYSYTMRKLDMAWNEENLDRYLAEGRDFIRGTTMRMPNMRNPEDRRAIIEYLQRASQ